MTQIKADNITNVAGTGAPDFADGVTVAGGSAISSLNLAEAYSQGTEPSSPKNGALWWDTANDKLYAYIASEWKEVEMGSTGGSWTVDLSNVTYDNASFFIGAQDTNPTSVDFSADGTKMYSFGFGNDRVYQYTLSTAWNVTTASYDNVNLYVGSQSDGRCITFKPDGTELYFVGTSNDTVFQYSLSTAWDLSTASYINAPLDVSAVATIPLGVAFKLDGTKMYLVDNGSDSIKQYTLSTAWDLSTASYDSVSFSVASQDATPNSLQFDTDGTKMYVFGYANASIFQYTLSTAWDLSTASYDNVSFDASQQSTAPFGVCFSEDGTKVYLVDITADTVYQYSTGL